MNLSRTPFRKTALAIAATLAVGVLPMQQALAADCSFAGASSWGAAGNADWTTGGNWSPAGAPNSLATDVCITNSTSTVTLSTAQTVGNLQIGAGNGLNITTGDLIVGGSSIRNDGSITNGSFMQLANNVTLSGAGVLTLVGGGIGTNGYAQTLTNQSTIQGFGTIGSNAGPVYQNLTFSNSGTVNANSSGNVLSIQGTGGTVTNTGVLQASGGGILNLAPSGAIANAGGTISANGGTVNVSLSNGQMIQGGTLSSSNGGVLQTGGTAGLDGLTKGAITLANGSTYIAGSAGSGTPTYITGVLNLGTGGASTLAIGGALVLAGDTTLNGYAGGVVSMNGGQIGTNGTASYTLTNNVTIQGTGVIGSNAGAAFQNLGLVNNYVINANLSGQTLSIQGTGLTFVNNGFLQATNGGTLGLNTQAVLNNSGGTIVANGSGSTVNLIGQTVQGGTLTATNGAVMQTVNSATLDGSTHGAITLSNGSTYIAGSAGSGTPTYVTGVLNLGTGSGSTLAIGGALPLTGNTTLNGAGGIVSMNGGQIGTNGTNYTLTNNVTIQGTGVIGSNAGAAFQNLDLVNNDLINANLSGQTLSIQGTGASFVNNGLLQATNGATLSLNTQAVLNNAGGSVVANGVGSTVNLIGQTVQGGTLTATNGAVMQTVNSATLDGSTLGAITLSNGSMYMAGVAGSGTPTYVTGALNLGSGSTVALGGALVLTGNATLNGAGVVSMNGGQIGTNGSNYALTNNATIQGTGVIGSNAGAAFQNLGLVNNGLITANLSGQTLSIQGTGGGVTGTGTLQTSGGTLNLATTTDSTQGKLVMGGTGSALNLNTQNLTITNDYTNAQSGSGNAFDRRAGVSGTGQILAGGNAAQAITGSAVTNGSTGNATLTIGNVRVGSTTTYDYQVANTGTTGPSLRGAIQTSVNGANLTDARLSGAGVTAGNYNTGAPGSSTGNLGVTFTASTAGALSPLTGQVLNLHSNFDNIADQKLNIVTGSGAAAYNAAAGNATSPVQVANQRIGGSNTAAVAIANTAAAGSFSEDLNASVGSSSGAATGSGSVAGRLAGTSNTGTGTITAGVDTSSAGAKTGTVTVNYQTAGAVNGVSNGLGTASVGSQAVTINGNVYQAAAGAIQTAALNFGTVQVGQSVTQNLVIRNTATGASGFVEDLNASFGSANGSSLISGSGTLNGILAGTNSTAANGAMTVVVNTGSAGAINGGIAVNYTTAGAVNGVSNGLGTASVGSQNYGVSGTIQATGNIINQASPVLNTTAINLGSRRVGDAAATANVSLTNQSVGSPQAALNASISSNGAPITAGGSVSLLGPGATSANQLSVGLSTATAGNFTGANAGSATLGLVSDASNVGNCAPNCQLTLASQQVTVSGKVYTAAAAQVNTTTVDFGIVHTGDTVATRGVSVTNAAAVSGLNDTLTGSLGGATGPFTATGALAGVAAQTTNATSFQAGLNTSTSGVFNGSATASLQSHNGDMSDLSLGSTVVTLKGQVNNYAQASLVNKTGSASLTHTGNVYTLDFGTLTLGSGNLTDTFSVFNSATGLADLLGGAFDLSGLGSGFGLSGFGAFAGLAAGFGQDGFSVTLDSDALGSFDDSIVLHVAGSNASGYSGALGDVTLSLRGNVVTAGGPVVTPVPEPATNVLMIIGLLALIGIARSRRAQSRREVA